MSTVTEEATDLLQHLIRNQCVNDGTADSGHEARSIDTLAAYLTASGVELKRYEPHPGRMSMVLRIEGSDPKAPSLHLCGHVDVVPVNPSGWTHDPFAGELIDGTVWGRGAVDMLDTTATMAVAVRRLLDSGFSFEHDLAARRCIDSLFEATAATAEERVADGHSSRR